MLLVGALLSGSPACWQQPLCKVVPDASERSCESVEDCELAYVDCARFCTCAPVNLQSLAAVEGRSAEACDTRACAELSCNRDCKRRKVVACQRGVCQSYDLPEDSGW